MSLRHRKYMNENFEPNLSYLLLPKGKTKQIGDERGSEKKNGIALYVSPHGSYRYVFCKKGEALAGLQVMRREGSSALAANVFVKEGHRRKGYATALLNRSRKDFGEVILSLDRSKSGAAWAIARESKSALRQREYFAEDEQQRMLRATATDDNYRLPNVHRIIPSYRMKNIPYRGESEVWIYRGTGENDPSKFIRAGDWVALSKKYAQQHVRPGGRLLKKKVKSWDIVWAGTDENEWFYAPLNPRSRRRGNDGYSS